MWLCRIAAFAMVLAQASAASNLTWSPCSFANGGDTKPAECTTYTAPLCHPGICETSESAQSTVDVFVKRLPARAVDPETAPNLWLLQGGIAYVPDAMDMPMVVLYTSLDMAVNIYTMDHRGVGNSTNLECGSASESSAAFDVPTCAQELQDKYGDLAAFSTTSAATDLLSFIAEYGNDLSTTVYGQGYGTIWVERLMHLNPPEVTGYVLDGVATTSGASPDQFMNLTSVDTAYGEIDETFFDLCAEDTACSSHFKKRDLKSTLSHLMTKLDKNPKSPCASVFKSVQTGQENDPPSFVLRYVLGMLLTNPTLRTLIPPVVYRLNRCSADDVDVVTRLVDLANDGLQGSPGELPSLLLSFSEMWESPTPSEAKQKARFKELLMSGGASYLNTPSYCAFSKEKSATCDALKLGDYEGNGIIYERDEYWNKAAAIPDQASVLLMGSNMDPLASPKYAETLLDTLVGDQKELVIVPYSLGGNLVNATVQSTCAADVLVSFVQGDGGLKKLDKSCIAVEENAAFSWATPIDYLQLYMGTDDAYDGVFNQGSSDQGSASDSTSGSGSFVTAEGPLEAVAATVRPRLR